MEKKRLLSNKDLQKYVSLGKSRADLLAQKASAKRRFGKRVLYDRELIDEYISQNGGTL